MRDGLIDLEAAAPQDRRGALTGAFYALSYLGFGLPLLLTVVGSRRRRPPSSSRWRCWRPRRRLHGPPDCTGTTTAPTDQSLASTYEPI